MSTHNYLQRGRERNSVVAKPGRHHLRQISVDQENWDKSESGVT